MWVTKAIEIKAKQNKTKQKKKWGLTKNKLLHSKGNHLKMKKQSINWEKIFTNDAD